MAYDWKSGGGGALTGAGTGFALGGPPGAAVGGLLGLLTGFGGSGDKLNKIPTKTKSQQALLNQLLGMISPNGQLGGAYNQGIGLQQQLMNPNSEAVQQFTQPYMDQFNNQIVPQLAERFAGMGAMGGGLSSSGFGQSLSAAGGQLQNQLSALKAGLGQQAAQSLMGQYNNMANLGLGTDSFAYQQQAPSMGSGMLQGYASQGFPGAAQGLNSLSDWYKTYNQGSGSNPYGQGMNAFYTLNGF